MAEKILEHFDVIGRPLKLGDCVAYPGHYGTEIGVITKMNPKMVTISRIGAGRKDSSRKYPADCVLIEPDVAVPYILQHSSR